MSDLVRGIVRPASAATDPGIAAGVAPTAPLVPRAAPPAGESPAPSTPVAGEHALLGELQRLLLDVRDVARSRGTFPWDRLESVIDRSVTSLTASADLFWFASHPATPRGGDHVAYHQARVAVLALRVGATLGYDRPRLLALGMAGALMDVGLWELPDTILRHLDALSGNEAAAYRTHPRMSADLVRRWGPPSERIVPAILDHHEREHGQGFPEGLQGAGIAPDAKILGLVDTYAVLTVPASSGRNLRPHEAIREIAKMRRDAFPPLLVKALLSETSVFPPDTVVRLNTREIGRVVAVNRRHPLRPRVEIIADGEGHRPAAQKIVDLSESPFLYVTGAMPT